MSDARNVTDLYEWSWNKSEQTLRKALCDAEAYTPTEIDLGCATAKKMFCQYAKGITLHGVPEETNTQIKTVIEALTFGMLMEVVNREILIHRLTQKLKEI